jgi:hypothetical protein
MSKVHQEALRSIRSCPPRKSFDTMDLNSTTNSKFSATRRRSVSGPVAMIDSIVELSNAYTMSKLVTDNDSMASPSKRIFDGLTSLRDQARGRSRQIFDRKQGKIGKSTLCCEYSDHGTGDFRTPSLIVVDNYNGSAISPLRYRNHVIYKGKLPMQTAHMPSIRCLRDTEASTLVVTLVDSGSGLEVDLIFGK